MAQLLREVGHTTFKDENQLKTAPHLCNGDSGHQQKVLGDNISDDSFATLAFRNLVFDVCMQNGGGHGGSAIGMAAIGVALWKHIMRYNPADPDWFDRDRFVLSNGHASIFLYVMNHLVGYDAWTMEQLKGYGDDKMPGFDTMAHGHPERDAPGVELTTGPLGQGIANAVGLAIASKSLRAQFNKPGLELVQSRIYCMTGDGCLMEGVALEAISLAGHLQLDNLVLVYDNNQVTCDGPLEWINSEDVNAKMRACGWAVLDVYDGSDNVDAIVAALEHAKHFHSQPVFINIRTVIGYRTSVAGTAGAHHGGFDTESIKNSKRAAGMDETKTHSIPDRALKYFRGCRGRGMAQQMAWNEKLNRYSTLHPEDFGKFQSRMAGEMGDYENTLLSLDSKQFAGLGTRDSNGKILEKLWNVCPGLLGGSADLVNANKIKYAEDDVFHPLQGYQGRYLRVGIREHAMAAIANGLAAYHPQTFMPVTATFFMFYLYAAPAVRMGALSDLQVIHIATHDSFAEGQNGPTHQPVELDSLFRAMPNLIYIRPCDGEELLGAWIALLNARKTPSILSVAREHYSHVPNTDRNKVKLGAYVIQKRENHSLTLASCGSNLGHVVAAAEVLEQDGQRVNIISAPSLDLFELQEEEYRKFIFPLDGTPVISVEEYVPTTWARYATASVGMYSFGHSGSQEANYKRFRLDCDGIVARVKEYLKLLNGQDARTAGWHKI